MAVNPYTSQSISGYNSSPPPDDGSQTSANKVEWAKHKTKLADPIKTLAEAINSQITNAVNTVYLWTATGITSSATIAESQHSRSVFTTDDLTLPDPGTLESGWHIFAHNAATGNIGIYATATNGIDAANSVTLRPNEGVMVFNTATAYFTTGRSISQSNDGDMILAGQVFS